MTAPEEKPLLKVVKGTPDDYQLAALTAVIAGLASTQPAEEKPERRPEWANPARRVRRSLQHGPGAWRASGFPG
ncbi:acetyl-CoA carboxylase biotin carboxyl carrier protein subunit [Lentzea pudingi]|uniref:Acetyl-CoA carboxylase biotin carboxyl carrier protein subunit n=1 Tax=Lentzea pudingi TaxID=1789439 RepID=A0ABQ2HM33_9PSEU|nr:acyl-CoA carboxylase subunit epsilon [Lentzea pudingi]GGM84271.1 acetyl-CoA carboxylase biotin carboxyl carrier protein subunit [Lentzea pudingi]